MEEKPSRRSGKANEPNVRSLPRNLNRPSEAMRRALAERAEPRADWRRPFVVASPWRILTAQAGIRVTKEKPNRLTTPIEADDRPDHGMGDDIAQAFLEIGHDRSSCAGAGLNGSSFMAASAAMTAMKDRPLIVKHQAGPKRA